MPILLNLIQIYIWIIIARALISWFNLDPANPLVRGLRAATDPLLKPLSRIVPPEKLGGLDISPLLAIGLLYLLSNVLIRLAY